MDGGSGGLTDFRTMKTISIITAALLCVFTPASAGEHVTLTAECEINGIGYSQAVILAKGETLELKFSSYSGGDFDRGGNLEATVDGKVYSFPTKLNLTTSRPVFLAGPAEVKFRVGGPGSNGPALKEFAVAEVTRAGAASGPVPIPAEAGTAWQVLLEASSDLVNWVSVQPGEYPSSTPQRYFRTRLVKRP